MRLSPNLVANYLLFAERHNPQGEVLMCGARRVTWSSFAGGVLRLAQGLVRRGIGRGHHVALMFANTPEFVEVNAAIQVAGAIPVPVNPRFTAAELAEHLSLADVHTLIFDGELASTVSAAQGSLGRPLGLVHDGAELAIGGASLRQLMDRGAPCDPERATAWDDTAVMQFTGGTTGRPKGVLLSYRAHLEMFAALSRELVIQGARLEMGDELLARAMETLPISGAGHLLPLARSSLLRRLVGRPSTARVLTPLARAYLREPGIARWGHGHTIRFFAPSMPFFHAASYQLLMLGMMTGNVCHVMAQSKRFDPDEVLDTVARERPYFMSNVPTGWSRLCAAQEQRPRDVSAVRVGATGAGGCSRRLKQRIMNAFPGMILLDMLGQTEMTPVTAVRMDVGASGIKEHSVGRAIVATRIVDDQGVEVAAGEVGEICYRAPSQMQGYYNDPAGTRSAHDDAGWFHSGDLGYLDGEGELIILERKGECINTGGEKVFPSEVEARLCEHPHVADACVIGVADAEWGQTIRAVIQAAPGDVPTEAELVAHCRHTLAGYKTPRSFVFVPELPHTAVGKLQRGLVRERYGG